MAERSHAYPSHTIQEMVEFVQKIYSKFGASTHLKREDIAAAFGLKEVTIQSDCSTCVQYGLLEMKKTAGYKPTSLFTSIFKPLNEAEKKSALIQALSNPELYQNLLREFSGQVVPIEGLATILFRNHNIAEKVSSKAAEIFIENIKYLNLIDADGKLRLNGAFVAENEVKENNPPVTTPIIITPQKENPENNSNGLNNNDDIHSSADEYNQPNKPLAFNILLKKKRTAQLMIPHDTQKEDLETIKNWISLMKDSFE